MRRNTFFKMAMPVFTFAALSLSGCENNHKQDQTIIGEWKAHWETKADESFSEISAENLHMEGTMTFNPDGKVEIAAYGYDGCIFSDDTLRNILNWKIDDSVIRFIDGGDENGLPYTINKFTNNEMHLTLLEDINLTLRRN